MSDKTNGIVNQSGANAASSMHTISNCFRISLGQFVAVRQVVVATTLFEICSKSSPRVAFLRFVEVTKVSFFVQCTKMLLITSQNFNIQTISLGFHHNMLI